MIRNMATGCVFSALLLGLGLAEQYAFGWSDVIVLGVVGSVLMFVDGVVGAARNSRR